MYGPLSRQGAGTGAFGRSPRLGRTHVSPCAVAKWTQPFRGLWLCARLTASSPSGERKSRTSMKTHLIAVAAAGLLAFAAFAGGLSKYKGWDRSPQGDLMTADERGQWANVKT